MALDIISVPATSSTHQPRGNIVLLHGWGANYQDLGELVPYFRLPEYQFFLPNAPFPHPFSDHGRMWYSFTGAGRLTPSGRQELAHSRQELQDLLQGLPDRTGVPLAQTWLGGFSQGGAMTLEVGLGLSLAGLIVMSGYLHPEVTTPASCPPVAILHGRQDDVVPIEQAWQARQRLCDWGAVVQYQELDMGHSVVPEELQAIRQFVLGEPPF
jgi:phospholipase/carboxylesterase